MKQMIWILCALCTLSSVAFGAGNIKLGNKAFVTKFIKKKNGTLIKQLVPAATVIPGTLVTYIIDYKNTGDENVEKMTINNPVPNNTQFYSAQGVYKLSVDGGKKFGALQTLKVKENGKWRAALKKDVTHVSWNIKESIQPNAEGKVKFTTRLK